MAAPNAGFPLDRFWDRQILDRDRYLGFSSTAAVRVLLGGHQASRSWEEAVKELLPRHPYLSCRVADAPSGPYLEPTARPLLQLRRVAPRELDELWRAHSDLCRHRFNMRRGPLALCRVSGDGRRELLELAWSHLLGDGVAAFKALADLCLLRLTAKSAASLGKIPAPRGALPDDLYERAREDIQLPELPDAQQNAWSDGPEMLHHQGWAKAELYANCLEWLRDNNVAAGVVDMMLLAFTRVFAALGQRPCLAAIESHRRSASPDQEIAWGNLATYSQLPAITWNPLDRRQVGRWLATCHEKRGALSRPEQAARQHAFVAALNRAVARMDDLEAIRGLLSSFLRADHFAVNNLGRLDGFFGEAADHVLGLGVNDSATVQEARLMTLGHRMYFNLNVNADIGLDGARFWLAMEEELATILAGGPD